MSGRSYLSQAEGGTSGPNSRPGKRSHAPRDLNVLDEGSFRVPRVLRAGVPGRVSISAPPVPGLGRGRGRDAGGLRASPRAMGSARRQGLGGGGGHEHGDQPWKAGSPHAAKAGVALGRGFGSRRQTRSVEGGGKTPAAPATGRRLV